MNLKDYLDDLWIGTNRSLHELIGTIEQMQSYGPAEWSALKKEALGPFDDEDEDSEFGSYSDVISREGSTAFLHISGKLVNVESWFNPFMGVLSYERIREAAKIARDHPEIENIVLMMNTPGGTVSGISETSDYLKAVSKEKPVYTYAGSTMCSAGYWLGCLGEKIYTSKLSNMGSIGVIAVHMEMSRMLEREGVTTTVFRTGKYKGIGNPYEPLSDDAKAEMASQMSKIYNLFKAHVAQNRGFTADQIETLSEGRVYFGYEAVENGLADAIMPLEEVLQSISPGGGRRTGNSITVMNLRGDSSMIVKLTEEQRAALAEGATVAQVLTAEQKAKLSEEDIQKIQEQFSSAEGGDGGEDPNANSGDDPAEGGEEPSAEGGEGDEGAPAPAAGDKGGDLVERLMAKNETLVNDLAESRSSLRSAEARVADLGSSVDGLKSVVVESINRMNVALGGSPEMASASSDSGTLLEMHSRTKASFNKRFPVGGKAEIQTEDHEKEDRAARYAPNVTKATRIRPNAQ